IFSGSGENIRYVSAGGEVKGTKSTRQTASKSHEKGKVFLWDFDGEFWADEIGNYKSSLKDNCPNAKNLTQQINKRYRGLGHEKVSNNFNRSNIFCSICF